MTVKIAALAPMPSASVATASSTNAGWRRMERWSRRAGAGVYGLAQKARHLGQPAELAANDEALVDRVQSIVFRNPEMPKGRVNINVEDGVVVLRGELDRAEQIQELEAAARKVPGVRDVTNHLHLPHTMAALRAGKHVLCEKPTALHAGEAAEMLAAAKASGRLHLIDHELRFHPRRRRLAERMREGFTGRLWSLDYRSAGSFRVDPNRPWTWWSDATQGGGVLGALGSHAVDTIRTFAGEIAGFAPGLRSSDGGASVPMPTRPI